MGDSFFEIFMVKDWLADPQLGRCHPATRGIWMDVLSNMILGGRNGKVTGSAIEMARNCRCDPQQMLDALIDLALHEAADVVGPDGEKCMARHSVKALEYAGKKVTCHTTVTLINRRMASAAEDRKSSNDRQQRKRQRDRPPPSRDLSRDRNGCVTTDIPNHTQTHNLSRRESVEKLLEEKT